MERSAQTPPNPTARPPHERRRSIRQKLHSPVYASFNGPGTGMVVDLSELIDLNEQGFAVQTAEKLEVNRAVTLCLELPETKSYIHGSGQVIWSDAAGRSGIRFATLPEGSRRVLKEWLLANLLIGSSNHAARTEQLARGATSLDPTDSLNRADDKAMLEPTLAEPSRVMSSQPESVPASENARGDLGAETALARMQQEFDALSALDSLPGELRVLGTDNDQVFSFITNRALDLTNAIGAALAFETEGKLVCRGRAGEISPPLGTPVDARQGLTGECITTGSLVVCEDMGSDPRVDPEIGRALGIGSLLAAPIKLESRVVGILELFFAEMRRFSAGETTILLRLVELIPKSALGGSIAAKENAEAEQDLSGRRMTSKKSGTLPTVNASLAMLAALPKPEPREPRLISRSRVAHASPEPPSLAASRVSPYFFRALIAVTIIVVAVVIGYVVGPLIEKRLSARTRTSQQFLNSAEASVPPPAAAKQVKSLNDLRRLADSGDADAQWQLGVRYHNGEEVPHDDTRAMLWFLRAAEQGQVTAEATLGAYYWAGRGVPQDLTKAYFWSALAFAQGDENSRSRLEGLASQMTKTQVTTARQQAEIWLRSHNAQAKSTVN